MIPRGNFGNGLAPPEDTEYHNCNFAFDQPDMTGPNPVGQRLFPGDDTPRTFVNCNMINAEPPPGSTVTGGGNTRIVQRNVVVDTDEIVTPGGTIVTDVLADIHHGNYINGAYVYLPAPITVITV